MSILTAILFVIVAFVAVLYGLLLFARAIAKKEKSERNRINAEFDDRAKP